MNARTCSRVKKRTAPFVCRQSHASNEQTSGCGLTSTRPSSGRDENAASCARTHAE
jgi:hypothetical protein